MSDDEIDIAKAYFDAGRLAEAEALCRQILGRWPTSAAGYNLLGNIARAVGKLDAAAMCLTEAARLAPADTSHRSDLAAVYTATGQAAVGCDIRCQVIALAPDRAAHEYFLLGATLSSQRRFPEAAAAFLRASQLYPGWGDALRNLAVTEHWSGRLEEARAAYRRAFEASGDGAMLMREALAIPVVARDGSEIERIRTRFLTIMDEAIRLRPRLADPVNQVGMSPFYLAYHGLDDRELQVAMARAYMAMCPSLTAVAPHCLHGAPPVVHPDGKIHIGFVSEHLHGHTIGRLNAGLIERLPRDRFHITLCTPPRPADPLRNRLVAVADAVIDLPPDLTGARSAIASQRLDIVYYPDIGMTPFTYFLAFARLAPVQCVTWGHPDTTGIPALDYFLSCDAMEPEDGETHYTETLVRLPGPTVYYDFPIPEAPTMTRRDFGLADDAHVYICPQSIFKFHPDFDPVLAEILRRDPLGILLLIDQRSSAPALIDRIAATAPDVTARIHVLPGLSTVAFIAALSISDVMLDPLHYSGGNTSLEALSRGLPIVTWPGAFMRARHTYGFYKLMGVEDLVAWDWAHYVDLAVRVATDREFRTEMQSRIQATSGVLFSNAGTITAIADFLTDVACRRSIRE